MDELLKLAFEKGGGAAYVLLAYVVARDAGPFLWRKAQGRNGSASLRSQMDKIELTLERVDQRTHESHDMLLTHGVRIEHLETGMRDLNDRCERRHGI